ncbi:MAG TPA: hypothetical protein VMB53_12850 [Gaiellaceae bacterium]|nr:hypothetical protein [Gaiellaceae bacterium]
MLATAAPPPPCAIPAARRAILAAPALRTLRPTLENGGGPDRVICHDLTRDGRGDMAVTIFSGGTAGDIAWVVFRRTAAGGWKLAHAQLHAYEVGLVRRGADLVESQPIYRRNDPNCCPSGGFDHTRYHWNGSRFVVTRRTHTVHFAP